MLRHGVASAKCADARESYHLDVAVLLAFFAAVRMHRGDGDFAAHLVQRVGKVLGIRFHAAHAGGVERREYADSRRFVVAGVFHSLCFRPFRFLLFLAYSEFASSMFSE